MPRRERSQRMLTHAGFNPKRGILRRMPTELSVGHHARLEIAQIPQLTVQLDKSLPLIYRTDANPVIGAVTQQDLRDLDRRLRLRAQP